MNLFQELRERRVPQIASGYVVGGWGVIQFLEFLEGRMAVTSTLVNLVGVGLLLLLPSIVVLAWVHGRPGRDTWGRIPKVLLPANVLAIILMLFFLFRGEELGAITETIEIQDENGAVSERVVPKSQFLRRLLVFYPENIGDQESDWARETLGVLLGLDLKQDVFVSPILPHSIVGAMKDAGVDDGHVPTRSLQRKIARDGHVEFFLTSTIKHENNVWIYTSELHESESGRILANRTTEADNLYTLTDLASRQIREDLGIPSAQLESSPDLPVVELTSSDLEAVKSQVLGVIAITHENNWEKAAPLLDDAVSRDPGNAMAQFLRFAVYQTLGDQEKSNEAIDAAMQNLYRAPERTGFMIKAQYYYNRQEVDKSMAVLKMWSQIYPYDSEAYTIQALYCIIQQDLPGAIAAYEKIMAIDPGQVRLVREIATLQQQMGNFAEAESSFLKFVEMYPTDTGGYKDLAECFVATGKFEKAREALEKAQLIDPRELDIILGLVDVDIRTGKFEKSENVLVEEFARAKTARDRIKILTRQLVLTELLGRSDQLSQVIDSFHSSLLDMQSPMQADLMYSMLLTSLANAGKPALSLEKIEVATAKIIPPYDKLTGVSRAWALVSLGRLEEAKVALAEATELAETFKIEAFRSVLSLVGGMIFEEEDNLEAAIPLFREAVATKTEAASIFEVRLARALRKNGQSQGALEVLEAVMKADPAQPEYHLEMALTLHQLGKTSQARRHLETAQLAWVSAHPDYPPALEAKALASEIN